MGIKQGQHKWRYRMGDMSRVERCENSGCECKRRTTDNANRYVYQTTPGGEWAPGAPICQGTPAAAKPRKRAVDA